MKILEEIIEKAEDTLEEIEWYGEKSHALRTEYKKLADTYNKIAETHIEIYKHLHEVIVELIEDEKRKGKTPPPEMLTVWKIEHEKLVKRFMKAKYLVDEYNKSY